MEDDVGVRKIVELIFVKKFHVTEEMTAQDSSFPPCLLTNDFLLKLRSVFLIRQKIVSEVWRKAFNDFDSDSLPSLEHYLNFVLAACLIEHTCQNKVFESFLSTCGLVKFISHEIFQRLGLNFCNLNSDIVMEFYECQLKNTFLRCGGFQRLVAYIHQHKYLKWNLDENDLAALDCPSNQANVYTSKKLEKVNTEKIKEREARESGITRQVSERNMHTLCDTMVKKILSTTTIQLPIPSSCHNPNQTEDTVNLNENTKTLEENLVTEAAPKHQPLEELPRCLSLNSDSRTDHATKRKEYTAEYERIFQAVLKYNRSKGSDLTNWNNQLLTTANEILDHLKDTIKSLIEILDEYDKE